MENTNIIVYANMHPKKNIYRQCFLYKNETLVCAYYAFWFVLPYLTDRQKEQRVTCEDLIRA